MRRGRGRRIIRAPLRLLRGFITIPGGISLLGVALALAAAWFEPEAGRYDEDATHTILSTLAAAAMTALSLIYSSVLIVFTLAAGNIAPRLLERFSQDRVNQIAVGALGALFLYGVTALTVVGDGPTTVSPIVGAGLGGLSALLLLVFIDRVASRVTIDEEIAEIGRQIDAQFDAVAAASGDAPEDPDLPEGERRGVGAPQSGYLNAIEGQALAKALRSVEAHVEFSVAPGDAVLEGDVLANIVCEDRKGEAEEVEKIVLDHLVIGARRTEEGDIRFSINLLLEIALRALSPGVNDAFTAIACVDRLAASLARAAAQGLHAGVFCDEDGAARVVVPRHDLADLIGLGFDPLRRACRDNLLVATATLRALLSLRSRLDGAALEEAERQIRLFVAGIDASDAIDADKAMIRDLAGDLGAG